MPVRRTVIFDFDGTIADTPSVALEIVNALRGEFGYREFRVNEFPELSKKSARAFAREDLGLSLVGVARFARRARVELARRIDAVRPVPGIVDALNELAARGYLLGIASSNSRENIDAFLARHPFPSFDFIHCGTQIFGKHRILRDALASYGLSSREALYVGDEVRDGEACKKLGLPFLAVAWGFNHEDALRATRPRAVCRAPEDLVREVFRVCGAARAGKT